MIRKGKTKFSSLLSYKSSSGGHGKNLENKQLSRIERSRKEIMNTFQLVCVRHGESAWNKDNRFCGWVDVSLSDNGIQEAHQAGKAIKNENLKFDMVFTSTLKRAFMTANIILSYCDQPKPPLIKNWQLNERHYGALTGLNKAEMAEIHGKEQVQIWRRSFDVRPPSMDSNHPNYSDIFENDAFKDIKNQIPNTESSSNLAPKF